MFVCKHHIRDTANSPDNDTGGTYWNNLSSVLKKVQLQRKVIYFTMVVRPTRLPDPC